MITAPLKHLVLDTSAVSVLCLQGSRSELNGLLNAAEEKGIRIWFYAGEYADLVRWSNAEKQRGSSSEDVSAPSPLQKLEQVRPEIQWLSALAGDLQDNDDPDPIAFALTRAATRLAGEGMDRNR